jgi:cysteine rich repeat protein
MFQHTVLALAIMAATTTFGAAVEAPDAARQACGNDANTYCPDDVPDREKVYACLVKNVNQLSPACKKIITDSLAPPQRRR